MKPLTTWELGLLVDLHFLIIIKLFIFFENFSCFKTEPKIELMPQANYNPTIQVKPEFDIYSQQQCQEQTMPNYSVTQVASSKNPKTSAKTRKMNNHALKRRPNFNSQNMIKVGRNQITSNIVSPYSSMVKH